MKHLPPRAAQEYQANIVVTQPRRLAAKTLARRVASDLGEEVGTTVGYAIARDSKRSSDTRITFVTTGYLLQVKQCDVYSENVFEQENLRQLSFELRLYSEKAYGMDKTMIHCGKFEINLGKTKQRFKTQGTVFQSDVLFL